MYGAAALIDTLRDQARLSTLRPAVRSPAIFLMLLSIAVAAGCSRPELEEEPVTLAGLDSALSELGGVPTATLERAQRWRMVSSIGAGLPPSTFQAEDLPEPRSRGAGLLQVYCVQCHWVPAPQMHSAAEWPILVRRMVMRTRTLKARMGGPLTTELIGDVLMRGMQTIDLPSQEDMDTLLAYLQEHSLAPAQPGEIGEGAEAELFIEQCSICHETPSPKAHTAPGWEQVVSRMRANMAIMDVEPLNDDQKDRIVAYLRSRADE